MERKRRGMVIKNTNDQPVRVDMATRTLTVGPGQEEPITSEEVRDPGLRRILQIRGIAIVRPTTEQEEEELRRKLTGSEDE